MPDLLLWAACRCLAEIDSKAVPAPSRPAPGVQVLDVALHRRPSLAQYLSGGGTVKLMAALDFSASNAALPGACMHQPGLDHSASTCQQIVCAFASALQVRACPGGRASGPQLLGAADVLHLV